MRKIFFISLISSLLFVHEGHFSNEKNNGKLILNPESLKKYCPPNSEKFEFLSNMHKMSKPFTVFG